MSKGGLTMVMTSDQIAAELQRKRNLGKSPDNPANQAIYDKLTPKTTPTFGAYGGKDNYAANQNARFTAANEAGDTDLIGRLQADSKRAGYALNPYTPKTTTTTNNTANPTSNDLLTSIRDLMTKQSAKELPQFNYDPNSDPVYQSALSRAKANAGTASGNAQAELNRRGILNSTITSDRLGQIEQVEYGRVSDEILPQLFQQAYGRHRDSVGDQYTAGRDELNDLGKLLDYQTGREDTTYDRNYQTGRDTRNDAVDDRNYNRGVLESDREYKFAEDQYKRGIYESDRTFKENARQFGLDYALQQKAQALQAQNAAQDNARGWASINLNRDELAYRKEQDSKQTPEYSGLSANQVLDNVRSLYTEDIFAPAPYPGAEQKKLGSKITSDPAKREQMFLNVVDSGLPTDSETRQVLTVLGFTKDEIDKYVKKYGG